MCQCHVHVHVFECNSNKVKTFGVKLAHTAGAYPGFCKLCSRLGVLLLITAPSGWDASPSQVTPQHFVRLS